MSPIATTDQRPGPALHHILWLCATVLLALGTLVLTGWLLHLPLLVQVIPHAAAMVANTAICFLLAGIALLLPANAPAWRRYGQTLIGGVILVMALAVLSQDITGVDLGIDYLVRGDWLHDTRPHPTRMAPNTAIAFALTGVTLILTQLVRHTAADWAVAALSLVILLIGLTAFAGYLFAIEFLFSWYPYTRMAVHTAAAFSVLGIALLLNRRVQTQRPVYSWGAEDRHILTVGSAILVGMALLAGVSGFLILEQQASGALKHILEQTLANRVDTHRLAIEQAVTSTRLIATRPDIEHGLKRLVDAPDDAATLAALRNSVGGFLAVGFSGVTLYDFAGRRVAQVGQFAPATDWRLPLNKPYQTELLWHNGVFLRVQAWLFDGRRQIGVVEAERPATLLTQSLRDIRGIGLSGAMQVCGQNSGRLLCFPSQLQPYTVEAAHRPVGRTPPIDFALNGETGLINIRDDRGRNVIAAYAPIADSGLGMVVQMDAEEVYRPVYEQLQKALLWLLGLAVLGTLLLRWRLRPLLHRLVESRVVLAAANSELRNSEARIRAIIESTTDAIFIKDRDGRYLLINSAGARLLGRSPEEVLGKDDRVLFSPDTAEQIMAGDRHVMETGSAMTYEDIGTAAGVTRVYLSNKAPYRDAAGNVIGMVGISRDITERKHAEEQARSLSLTDQLTGLYNRRGFLTLATPLLERESRTQRDLYLFFADMDGLKYINDTFGHVEGDQAITDATRLLRAAFRESDILARLGGDEFAVLAPDTHPDDADKIIGRLQEQVAAHNLASGRAYRLSLTIGAVRYDPVRTPDIDALLVLADAEMYRRKKQRRA